jgi:preprotein translocase subunit SecA
MSGERLFPSFGLSLLLKELNQSTDLRQATLDLIARAIDVENEHHLRAIENLIDTTEENFEAQLSSRGDTLDAYFEGLRDMDDTERPRPQKMLEEINGLTGMQLRLNGDQLRRLGEDPEEMKEDIRNLVAANLTVLYASRVISAVQNRFGEALADKFEISNWDDAADKITEAAKHALQRRRERLVGDAERGGQIRNDIHNLMPRDPSTRPDGQSGERSNDTTRLQLLLSLSQGARTDFDQKTHRQIKRVFTRFSYVFLIAQLLEGQPAEQVIEDVLTHLDEAEEALRFAWGQREYARLSANAQRLADFGVAAKMAFGEDRLNEPVADLGESDREALVESVGRYALNEVHRQLLLSATTELWVDYLTRIEALRVSIGLEAYAQRDPLVQYKAKASEMFTQLVEDIRGLVISRVFAYQPRPMEITPVEVSGTPAAATQASQPQTDHGKKKKRRRH